MPPRKRIRKRKRRNVSSSSEDSSSESSADEQQQKITTPTPSITKAVPADESSDSSDSESLSSESSSSSSDSASSSTSSHMAVEKVETKEPARRKPLSQSPTPPTAAIPPFLPSQVDADAAKQHEKELKEKFRKFWMASVADAFKDDLEEIRKEPNLDHPKLSLLIDSLASGSEVFQTVSATGETRVDEMEIVMGST